MICAAVVDLDMSDRGRLVSMRLQHGGFGGGWRVWSSTRGSDGVPWRARSRLVLFKTLRSYIGLTESQVCMDMVTAGARRVSEQIRKSRREPRRLSTDSGIYVAPLTRGVLNLVACKKSAKYSM